MNELVITIGVMLFSVLVGLFQAQMTWFFLQTIKTREPMAILGGVCIVIFFIAPLIFALIKGMFPAIYIITGIIAFLYAIATFYES